MTSILHCLTNSVAGGAQQIVFQLVKELLRGYPEFKHTVMLPPEGVFVERFRQLGVPVLEVSLARLSAATTARMQSIVRPGKFAVVHSHGKGAGMYARFLRPGGAGVRRIHSFHGVHPPTQPLARRLYVELERRLVGATDTFVAVSADDAHDIIELTGVEGSRVALIPNVVDCAAVRAAAEEKLTADLPLRGEEFLISMIARRDPLKHHELAFEAAALVLQRVSSAVFVFAGVPENDRAFVRLKQQFPNSVFALTGIENAAPLIKRSDALLLTSRREAGPLVVLEAFCLGKPVVATDVPGIRGQIAHRRDGLLCAETPEAVAEALTELATSRRTYEELRENASKTGDAMDVHEWATRYARLYTNEVA